VHAEELVRGRRNVVLCECKYLVCGRHSVRWQAKPDTTNFLIKLRILRRWAVRMPTQRAL
jgi:hypothetical protein